MYRRILLGTDGSPTAARAVARAAEVAGYDLLVVGSKGMTPGRLVLGSVPDNVSHHSPCPLLIVQPT